MRVRWFGVAGLSMFAFLVVGVYVTAEFRKDSLDLLPSGLTYKQKDALRSDLQSKASVCLDHPLVKAFVLKTTLREFQPLNTNESPREYSGDRNDRPSNFALSSHAVNLFPYEAILNKYTLFAIPIGTVRVVGDTIYC